MKNLFLLLSLSLLTVACSKKVEPMQGYTSFVIKINPDDEVTLPDVVSGYFDAKGYCWKIAEHGTLSKGQTSEETILNIEVDTIYIFSDYFGVIMFNNPFVIQHSKQNIFNLSENPLAINVNKKDSLQYPQ